MRESARGELCTIHHLLLVMARAAWGRSFRAGRVRIASSELGSIKVDDAGLASELLCPAQLPVGADVSLG